MKLWFCSGSRTWKGANRRRNADQFKGWTHQQDSRPGSSLTSRRAAAGSPCRLFPSLSTSSRRKTGLLTPTVFKPLMIRPGMLPTYVRLQTQPTQNPENKPSSPTYAAKTPSSFGQVSIANTLVLIEVY